MTPPQLALLAHAPWTSTMVGLGPPPAAAAPAVPADAIWLSGMTRPAMATITAAIMSRSLPGHATRVMFTEVPFPGAQRPCGRQVVRLQEVTSADRSARSWFLGQPSDAALVRFRVTSHGLSLHPEPSRGVSAGLLHFPAGSAAGWRHEAHRIIEAGPGVSSAAGTEYQGFDGANALVPGKRPGEESGFRRFHMLTLACRRGR